MSILFAIFCIVLIVVALLIIFKTFSSNDKISGINIIVALIFVIVVWYFLQWAYWRYKSMYKLTSIVNANEAQTIEHKKLPKTNANNFTMSSWFYVDNWNHKFGKEKHLLQFEDGSFRITLGDTENDINIAIKTYKGGTTSRGNSMEGFVGENKESLDDEEDEADNENFGIKEGFTIKEGIISGRPAGTTGFSALMEDSFGSNRLSAVGSSRRGNSKNTGSTQICDSCILCQVKNFPLQKWVNLTVSVYGRTLDVYIDGKLVKTCILDGIVKIAKEQNLLITHDGGFQGWTSNITYMAKSCNPQEAYNIYKKGYGLSWFNQLFNKYRFRLSFLKDNVVKGEVYL